MMSNSGLISISLDDTLKDGGKLILRSSVSEKKIFYFYKRLTDVAGSLIFLVTIMSWLTPIIALLIKCTSKGSIFFLQKRAGKNGVEFNCFKFRTMVINDEADNRQANEDDERITMIGKFLRKTNIDEFPQFLNVLIGDMSIVGPRPHMLSECKKFSMLVPNYELRNIVKPGITGLAQVKGFHGPTPDFENIFRRYQWDCFYVRNASFFLDMRIICRTALQRINFLFIYF